jgi:catechol 2,3-dioxygenase-like lactoylglutathione lyase family enzyme
MSIRLSHTFLAVRDQDESLAFYRDVLGLDVVVDVMFDDFRWLSLGSKELPGVELVLEQVGMGNSADVDTLKSLLAKGSLKGVIFLVDDVDGTFERIRAAGAEVLQEPIDQPYGVRDCAFRDPSGNMLRFSETLPS